MAQDDSYTPNPTLRKRFDESMVEMLELLPIIEERKALIKRTQQWLRDYRDSPQYDATEKKLNKLIIDVYTAAWFHDFVMYAGELYLAKESIRSITFHFIGDKPDVTVALNHEWVGPKSMTAEEFFLPIIKRLLGLTEAVHNTVHDSVKQQGEIEVDI